MIPLKVAHLLSKCPQLISSAVEAFYTRDPIGMKVFSFFFFFLQKETQNWKSNKLFNFKQNRHVLK